MQLLECRCIKEEEMVRLKKKISSPLTLAIIQIGIFPENELYLKSKKKLAEALNVSLLSFVFSENDSKEAIIQTIDELNHDFTIQGIMIQKPILPKFSYQELVDYISYQKDIDGVSLESKKRWCFATGHVPCTARSVLKIFDYYHVDLWNKNIVIVGKSDLSGMPLYQILKEDGYSVSLCDSKTKDLKTIIHCADVLVLAIGCAHYFTRDYFRDGQIIIDVGTNYLNGKLVGDVMTEELHNLSVFVTPVPFGVGQLTPLYLFDNLYLASKM